MSRAPGARGSSSQRDSDAETDRDVPLPRETTVLYGHQAAEQAFLSSYRSGRVFLAGDAAHLNSPSGGMGMNGGIHDAFNLAEKLIAVLLDGTDDAILDRYERQRRPVAEEEIIQQAHRNRTRMQERDPARRREMLNDLQRTADDPAKLRAYLLKSSMIDGLRRAAATV